MSQTGGAMAEAYVDILVSTKFARSLAAARSLFAKSLSGMSKVAGTGGLLSGLTHGAGAAFAKLGQVGMLAFTGMKNALGGLRAGLASILGGVRSLINPFTTLLPALGGAAILGGSVMAFAGFEQRMARVKALTNASKKDFQALWQQARKLGAETAFSADQAAEAMGNFAQAGFTVREISQAMGPTLDLAAAGQLDMATSSDIVSKVMRGMGLDATETAHAVDVMAKAVTTANTDLPMLGEAFKYVGPVGKAAGKSLEEVAASIQIMSDAGIQGGSAGAAMRNILLRLQSQPKDVKKTLDALGVSIEDSMGRMKPMATIVDELNVAMAGMSDMQKSAAVGAIADTRATAAFLELLDAGGDKLRAYEKRLAGASGTAQRIAATQMDTLQGSFEMMSGAISEVAINLGAALAPALRIVASSIEDMMPTVANMASGVETLATSMGTSLAAGIYKVNGWLRENIDLFKQVFGFLNIAVNDPFAALTAGAQTVQAAGLDLFAGVISGLSNFVSDLRALFSATITTWAQKMGDAIWVMGETIKIAAMKALSYMPGMGHLADKANLQSQGLEMHKTDLEKMRDGAYERNLTEARGAILNGPANSFMQGWANEMRSTAAQIRHDRAAGLAAAQRGIDATGAPMAAYGMATSAWDFLKGAGTGVVDMGRNVWDGVVGEFQKSQVADGGKKKVVGEGGGDITDVAGFLAGMQKEILDKKKDKDIADTADATGAVAKEAPKQTGFMKEIRDAVRGLNFGFTD
jgi:TP901 family phage tail tape measure protein